MLPVRRSVILRSRREAAPDQALEARETHNESSLKALAIKASNEIRLVGDADVGSTQ